MNKFEKSLERMKKNMIPGDDWTAEDWEHLKTIEEALRIASETEGEQK